jgi:hypothetical protein
MFSNCSNPDCGNSFDYRRGRLFRFHNNKTESENSGCCVRHFWLCEGCAQTHILEYRLGTGVVIRSRSGTDMSHPYCICSCETAKLSRCLGE